MRDAKTFRPEIISRFDQIYVFRPPSEEVKCDIAGLKIAAAAKEYGVEVAFIDPELVADIIEQSAAAGDVRELVRIVDATLGDLLLRAREMGARSVRVIRDEEGKAALETNGSN